MDFEGRGGDFEGGDVYWSYVGVGIGGRRLYANIYHPSFSTAKHFKKIAQSLGRKEDKRIEKFNMTQGELEYRYIPSLPLSHLNQ